MYAYTKLTTTKLRPRRVGEVEAVAALEDRGVLLLPTLVLQIMISTSIRMISVSIILINGVISVSVILINKAIIVGCGC